MMSSNARNASPFTATQWQELEHQALIFKYMVSGVPIPSDLIYSIKRSFNSSISSRLFPHNPVGWGCIEMGYGRKVDPEPGRCKRTDGKKWRCSKEAYPDSKYCERHMHRGRHRSRKPVEIPSSSSTTMSTNSTSFSPLSSQTTHSHLHPYHDSPLYPLHHPHSLSSKPHPSAMPFYNTIPQLFLSNSQPHTEYRYTDGQREGVDERAFFPEASGTARSSFTDSYQPLTVDFTKGCSQSSQFQSLTSRNTTKDQPHCFVLGTDFKSSRSSVDTEKETETQKPLHHFFEEWPLKNSESWLDLSSNQNC